MLWVTPALFLAVLLQGVVLPGMVGIGLRLDFALVIVVGWAIVRGWQEGLLAGLIAGLTADLLSAAPFGLQMVRLGIVGVLAGFIMVRLARSSPLLPVAAAVVASLLAFVIGEMGREAAGWSVQSGQAFLREEIPNALLTGALMAVTFPLIRGFVGRMLAETEEPPL